MRSNKVAFTICAKNRLPAAKVCRDSFVRHNPGVDFIIILSDRGTSLDDLEDIKGTLNCYVLKEMPALSNLKLEEMAFKYDVTEFSTAIKPFCLEYLIWIGYDKVCYFDPDIKFYESCADLYRMLDSFECVLTPHITQSFPNDHKIPNDINILTSGIYNLGFCGFATTQRTIDFIQWWQLKLMNHCYNDINNHMMTDQLWANFIPSFLDVLIIKQRAYNMAYWNLHECKLSQMNGKWLVNNFPLHFYHFSGLDYLKPDTISKHQNRYDFNNRPEVVSLIYNYLSDISKYDAVGKSSRPWYFDNKLDQACRKTSHKFVIDRLGDPFIGTSKFGFNIYGNRNHVNGVGEVCRNFITKINTSAVPYVIDDDVYDHTIYFNNLDMLSDIKKNPMKTSYAVCWWEVDGPVEGAENIDKVDYIITLSDYVYGIFKKEFPDKNIIKLPYPFTIPKQGQYDSDIERVKRAVGISPDDFMYHFSFNYDSSVDRKNPIGLIHAFAALHDLPKVKLVIKTLNAKKHPVDHKKLFDIVRKYKLGERVLILDGEMSKYNALSIINACDCYVSLHRSEGLGLTLLEAASLGKPIIATRYGGCLDFLKETNSLLVKAKEKTLTKDVFRVYKQGSIWGEPSITEASAYMRSVYNDSELRRMLSERATEDIIWYANDNSFCQSFYNMIGG